MAKALGALNSKGKAVHLTENQTLKWMKSQGISQADLRLGLTQHKVLLHQATYFFSEKGKDMEYVMNFLAKQGITGISIEAMHQRILKVMGVYAPIPNDIVPSHILGYDRAHYIELKSTQDGGLGQRKQTPGRIMSHKVNLRLGRITAALRLSEAQILFLYGNIIEDTRPDWIIAYHYETYGRRNFGTIISKFFPMQLNLFPST